jgi:hypothetical protein
MVLICEMLMATLSDEYVALCRSLGDAQRRCSDVLAEHAREMDQLRAEVRRLRDTLALRDTQLARARDALALWLGAQPGSANADTVELATRATDPLHSGFTAAPWGHPAADASPLDAALDAHLAAADLVICQTGCISHDHYWRVQDHCRRTGKTCLIVDGPLSAPLPASVAKQFGAAQPRAIPHVRARTDSAQEFE